ncbi:MAG: amidohydrolase [SAR202 cluster bacterium]|nr:amidohydrolase [SAR202 cluster bacterium]
MPKSKVKVISSDSHIVEPPDLWLERMDKKKFGDRVPHMEREKGADWWYADHRKVNTVGSITQAGLRFERPQDITNEGKFQDVFKGGYDPHAHVKDMDIDGVYGGVVYPSIGLALYREVVDPAFTREIFAAYNDWLADFCSPHPDRLKGVAMINIDDDVEAAISELKRCADIGLAGAMISSHPRAAERYEMPLYEPFWAAAQDLNMPLALHVTTNRPELNKPPLEIKVKRTGAEVANNDYWVRVSLAHIILSGVPERFPNLKFANVEHELGWIPFFMNRLDFVYTERRQSNPYRFKGDTLPSDFMKRQVYHSFQEDALGVQMRHLIGVDNLMWGSDYPHAESTFPQSQRILNEILEGVPPTERAKIVGHNSAKVYNFA